MHRTTSVLALGLFLGLAPIGALAQTQTDDTDTQEQLTQPSETQESTESTESEPLESDDQQATETEEPESDDQQATEAEEPESDDQQATEAEEPETDDQQATETEPLETDDQQAETDAEEEPDVATAPTEEVIPAQEESEMLASSLLGSEVQLADESIGKVSDLIIGEDHMIKGVVVGVGGFLGIGEKKVALPMETITIQPTEEPGEVELSTNATREQLEAYEEFKTAADVRSEEEAAQTQQQMDAQQPPAVPTQPTQPQQ